MFQDRTYLAPATVAALTEAQIKQLYKKLLPRFARGMGFGKDVRSYLESGGIGWDEFLAEFKAGKRPVLASDLPEVYADELMGLVGSSEVGA